MSAHLALTGLNMPRARNNLSIPQVLLGLPDRCSSGARIDEEAESSLGDGRCHFISAANLSEFVNLLVLAGPLSISVVEALAAGP